MTSGSDDDRTQSYIALTAGTQVSHYQIIEKIGAGGMGEVYLAEDSQLDRKVALKFLPAHLCQDEDCRARFAREAKAAAKLDHLNIVQVFEVGEFRGRPFIAMAHIEGRSLRELIKDGKLSISETIELTKQICEGLNEAHNAGVIHRDIKPGNVIIDNKGQPRILDFGLATVAGEEKLTKTGSTLGTAGYMSPEQIEGKKTDQRSDLFSVGVILYEMLTGRRPFEGDTDAAVARAITDKKPEPIARYKSGTTGELQQIIDKALQKDPSLRYQHADGMLADLKRLRPDVVSRAKPGIGRVLIPIAIVITALLVLILKPWRLEIGSSQEAVAQDNKLAIMYFDNMADPGDSLRLGEIATNLLITDLSESEFLRVVSSQHIYDLCRQFGGKGSTSIDRDVASRIARRAKARYMVLGKILRSAPNLIMTTELIDIVSGDAISAKRIEGTAGEDIFPLIDSLTIAIKKDLGLASEALEEPDPSVAGITTGSIEAYRLYLSAAEDFYNVRYVDMIKKLDRCLELDSTFAMAYSLLSERSQGGRRQFLIDRAVRYSDQASEKEQLYIKAQKAECEQDLDLSVDLLKQIVDRFPDEKGAHNWLGYHYHYGFGKPEKAIQAFEAATNIDPHFGAAYHNLAFAYFDLGDFENSHRCIDRYIELSDSCANALDTKGLFYGLMGNTDKAIVFLKSALEVDPNSIRSSVNLGQICAVMGDYSEAEKYFRRLTRHENFAIRSLGRLYVSRIPIHQGKFEEALLVLDDGIAADKMEYLHIRTALKHLWKAAIYQGRGQYDNAMDAVDNAETIIQVCRPEVANEFRYRSVELLADQHEFEKAMSLAEDIKSEIRGERRTLIATYWYALAYVEYARANYEQSAEYAERACANTLHTSLDYFRFHAFLGRVHLACGRLGEAVADFEEIINVHVQSRGGCPVASGEVYYWLGMAYEASGWTNKAIAQYETFLDIWKNADEGLKSVENAKQRLAQLTS